MIFSIGPVALRWYSMAYIAGLMLGWVYARKLVSTEKLWRKAPPASVPQIDDLLLWIAAGVIIGGRLGYVLFYDFFRFAGDPMSVVAFWRDNFSGLKGMSFHGGLIGVIVMTIWYCRRRNIQVLQIFDVLGASVPIGLFFGRIANFINAELFGRPGDVPWAIIFPIRQDPLQLPRHPSQLYEAALEGLVLFIVIAWLVWARRALHKPGLITGVAAAGYGLARIFAEFYRMPDAHIGYLFGPVTMGMVLSLPLVLVGIWLVRRAHADQGAAG